MFYRSIGNRERHRSINGIFNHNFLVKLKTTLKMNGNQMNLLSVSAINNILNFLVTVNAASNFLLYCALSDKYRKTVRSLFCSGRPARNRGLLNSSRYISGRTSTSFFSKSQSNGNFSNASTKTTALCSNRVKPKKRFSITQEDYTNLQAETARLKNPRVSITPEPRKNGEVNYMK